MHNDQGATVTYANPAFPNPLGASYGSNVMPSTSNAFVPIVNDPGPFPGSEPGQERGQAAVQLRRKPDQPGGEPDVRHPAAVVHGGNINEIIANDPNPLADLLDVQHDIETIASKRSGGQLGLVSAGLQRATTPPTRMSRRAPATPNPTNDPGLNTGYILHHNGPQYFGYLADNPQVLNNNLHGAKDFFQAVEGRTLPASGGVFYLRGGYNNNDGLVPVDPTPAIQHAFLGNDDHPAYSDQQISEAFAAKAINDIANSPYWDNSAIIITYDETDGFYDHVSPERRSTFADGSPLAAGPRIPTILISPYRPLRQDLAPVQRAWLGHQVHQRAFRPCAARLAAGRGNAAGRWAPQTSGPAEPRPVG